MVSSNRTVTVIDLYPPSFSLWVVPLTLSSTKIPLHQIHHPSCRRFLSSGCAFWNCLEQSRHMIVPVILHTGGMYVCWPFYCSFILTIAVSSRWISNPSQCCQHSCDGPQAGKLRGPHVSLAQPRTLTHSFWTPHDKVSPFFVYIICCSRISSITWQVSAFHSDVAEYILSVFLLTTYTLLYLE